MEGGPVGGTGMKIAPQLSDFRNLINKKITLAQKQYDEVGSKEVWEVTAQGFPVEPRSVATAAARLKYLKEARDMFYFSDLQDANAIPLSWESAIERADKLTKFKHDRYVNLFGAKDPKDVEENKRGEAKKALDEIKQKDKIVTEFSSFTL